MTAAGTTTEEALQGLRERFARILDKYSVTPEDRAALARIELEFFQIKSELLGKLDHLMKVLRAESEIR